MMRPTTAILLAVSLSFPPASALAQDPAPTLSLPAAKVPEPQFVSAGIELSGPTPVAERVLRSEDGEAVAPPADTPDDPAVGAEIDKDSAEMEEMRQAEEAARPAAGASRSSPSSTTISRSSRPSTTSPST